VTKIADQCHACSGFKTEVLDSRRTGITVRRRRRCTACGARWTTYELRADFLRAFQAQGRIFFSALPPTHHDHSKEKP
jgi:hypothetical protein